MELDKKYRVDVIIPTLNSEKTLEDCLASLNKQRFGGKMNIVIIDGGSTDRTIDIAKKFGVTVYVKSGMYGTGKNGARHYGELITNSPFIWNVDSDNIIVEDNVLDRLVAPLIADVSINISIPMTDLDAKASSFNNWISLVEISKVESMFNKQSINKDGYILLKDMDYGLTNCALVRRSAIEMVGGYDSDVRTLYRLRRAALSKGVVDTKSHLYHNQVDSIFKYLQKWNRRLKFFGKMNEDDLKKYFVEYPPNSDEHKRLQGGLLKDIFEYLIVSSTMFRGTGDRRWLWGLIYPFAIIAVGLLHPIRNFSVFKKFL